MFWMEKIEMLGKRCKNISHEHEKGMLNDIIKQQDKISSEFNFNYCV